MNNANVFYISYIQAHEFEEVADILTEAFETNPAYSIIFKKENLRRAGLFWVFKASLLLNNQKQVLTRVVKEKKTGKIVGTYALIPPQGVKNSIATYSKIGIPGFIARFGMQSFVRMLQLDKGNKSALTKSMQTATYYYLSMVVIREEYRGYGIGSYAVKSAIQDLRASNPTCKRIGLTTQLPENVQFYSRLGFVALDEGTMDFKGERYYNCNMKYVLTTND